MIFRRYPTINEENYARWLRAGRPPFDWFMRQNDEQQEAMAQVGDEYAFLGAPDSEGSDLAAAQAMAQDYAERAGKGGFLGRGPDS